MCSGASRDQVHQRLQETAGTHLSPYQRLNDYGETANSIMLFYIIKIVILGHNCTQNCHLGRLIVSFLVGNFVLRRCVSRAVKCSLGP